MKMKTLPFLCFISFTLFITACSKTDQQAPWPLANNSDEASKYTADVAASWYSLELRLIKETPGFSPPVASRAIGYTGIALYETVVQGMRGHYSLSGQLSALSGLPSTNISLVYNWNVSANAALAAIIKELFATATSANLNSIDSLEAANYTLMGTVAADVFQRSKEYGQAVAEAIFNWSKTDGGHEAYLNLFPSDYVIPVGEGLWEPTPPAFSKPMLPYWGNNRTLLAVNGSSAIDPMPCPKFSTTPGDEMYQAAYDVYQKGKTLTQQEKDIATYWADGAGTATPPGHAINIVSQLIKEQGLKLDRAAVIFAQASIGLYDASIVCWKGKYQYNLMRPITYIKTYFDAGWNSYIGTPPFPSYTSGHATFSGLTAKILENHFGRNYAFTDSSQMQYGLAPRSFSSFQAAADEAAISRFYGGIHYKFDSDAGLMCGADISNNVLSLRW